MTEKKQLMAEKEEKTAFANGVEVTQFFALFNYFLNETPEGKTVKKELNEDWQRTLALLKEEKKLRGSDFSCGAWLRQVQKELLATNKKEKADKEIKVDANNNGGMHKKNNYVRKPPVKFKNVGKN